MTDQMIFDIPADIPDRRKELNAELIGMIPHGEANAISNKELSLMLRTDSRTVREMIHDAREDGAVICSTSAGYFQPENYDELLRYVRKVRAEERSKYRALMSAEKALREFRYQSEEVDSR